MHAPRRPTLIGAIMLVMLIAVFGEVGSGTLGQAAQNAAHVPAFGLITWLTLRWLQASGTSGVPRRQESFAAFVVGVALGIVVELLQALLGRDAEILDVLHDALGSLAALSFVSAYITLRNSKSLRAILYAGCALIIVALGTYPLAWGCAAWLKREHQFPTLVEFDSRLDAFFMTANHMDPVITAIPPPLAETSREKALRLVLNAGTYPGIDVEDVHENWKGYSALSLDATNPTDKPVWLTIRVHDAAHNFTQKDRFTRAFLFPARTRTVTDILLTEIESAPQNRSMRMDHIRGVIIFSAGAQPGAVVLLKKLWLH